MSKVYRSHSQFVLLDMLIKIKEVYYDKQYQVVMFLHRNIFLYTTLLLCLLGATQASGDIWNRWVHLESGLTASDYLQFGQEDNNKKSYNAFSLQLFSNQTFELAFTGEQQNQVFIYQGSIMQDLNFSLSSHSYILHSSDVSGVVSYQINKGLKWVYHVEIKSKNIFIKREQVKYSYINQVLLLLFGILGVVLLPLSDRIRNKMLYNIRKRTHPLFCYFILLKLTYVVSCFMFNCYYFITNSPWYFIFLAYGVYLFMVSPSIIHSMYFITSIQKQLKEDEWFKQKNTTQKCLIMSGVILSIPCLAIGLLYVQKGIIFYFICSGATLYQYLQACWWKRYGFGKVLIYDLLLTAILTLFSGYMPSLNFSLVTLKQEILFWNYYLAIFIFGVVLTRIIIKSEMAEEIYLQENNDSAPQPGESERRHELPKVSTNEVLQP